MHPVVAAEFAPCKLQVLHISEPQTSEPHSDNLREEDLICLNSPKFLFPTIAELCRADPVTHFLSV